MRVLKESFNSFSWHVPGGIKMCELYLTESNVIVKDRIDDDGKKGISLWSRDFISLSRSIRQGFVLVILHSEESDENAGRWYWQFFRYFVSFNFNNKQRLSIVILKIMKTIIVVLYCVVSFRIQKRFRR
jgi:hypothetical protein